MTATCLFQYIRFFYSLSIKIFPKKAPDLEECEPQNDPMTTSFYGDFIKRSTEEKGPFSSKKVVHESDTPHPKPQKGNENIFFYWSRILLKFFPSVLPTVQQYSTFNLL